ncbi:RICIN domain-containing protein [Arthrobacter woluwensis]|uniref:RICIN domain-containing protein n=1 Tax=Arthrobacter woluwensis TaxID=156980 RepID=UPI0037F72212
MKTASIGAAAAVACLLGGTLTAAASAPASAATTSDYTVSTGSVVQVGHATDTPAWPYLDKDGSFYFQQSAALYGATEARRWDFYTGTTLDTATFNSTLSNYTNPSNSSDSNGNTTWRCNNSPTGTSATFAPDTSSYSQKNYCDLTGVWVDPDTGDWYGLVHNEFTPKPFGDGVHYDAIDYAKSSDQGKTWTITGHVITSPYSTTRNDTTAFPNQTYYYGDGDPRLVVDTASGYFYVFYGSRVINKNGGWAAPGFAEHVARAPISQKMAPSSWQKYYNGSWSTPGVGGAESTIVSTSQSSTGYLPSNLEYKPSNTGSVAAQAQAGQLPTNGSDLFILNVSYNAYLGMYIGTPQTDLGDGVNRPLHFYGTTDLATQKWVDLGTAPNYTQQSWYRWLLDGTNATSTAIVGKTFRSYCYFACSVPSGSTQASSSEYVNVTIDAANPARTIDSTKSYRIQSAAGQSLNQSGTSTLSTVATSTAGSTAAWKFTPTGDGAYTITNTSSGLALGVNSSSTANRAWGTALSLASLPSGGATQGQQWFVISKVSTPSSSGAAVSTGTYSLVNRYSGLVLSLTGSGKTAPVRTWTNSGSAGDTSTPAAQTITLAQVPTTGQVRGAASGRCLDVPNSATANGTLPDLWDCNSGANQQWTTAADGTVKVYGAKCLDVPNSQASAGSAVEIWDCNGGANQQWTVNADGTIRSALSPTLCLDVTNGSTANGAGIQLWTCTGNGNQRWTLG